MAIFLVFLYLWVYVFRTTEQPRATRQISDFLPRGDFLWLLSADLLLPNTVSVRDPRFRDILQAHCQAEF